VTGDRGLLDEPVTFLQAPPLQPNQEDSYGRPGTAPDAAPFYEHCARAIDVSLGVGPHDLPLIGTCDWNDGFSAVGAEGKGESIWMAWFLLATLPDFIKIAEARRDTDRARRWHDHAERLRQSVEASAWDGEWYLRGYFDDGTPLGSHKSDECRIDSLGQSWAVISGRADPDRAARGMAAVWERLVRPDGRMILLFEPPFDKAKPNPGYIAGYLPGVRENGGQYTHAATWVVKATALLGGGARAVGLLDLVNPVRTTATAEGVARYATEPYVLAADVYSARGHVGRGGWTWYTGSAGWYYRVVVEDVLGLELRDDRLTLRPCVPPEWREFTVTIRYRSATYVIHVANPAGSQRSVRDVRCDGEPVAGGVVRLADDGGEHRVDVTMG
jgi:cyclic beta-1,2-glucan synthetase